jgi:hypothetical protein
MNTKYLNKLLEINNQHKVDLEESEKVVFIATLTVFGTEKGRSLGMDTKFTLTNKRIFFNNESNFWTINIENDVASCIKKETGRFIFKYTIFELLLNKEIIYHYGTEKLNGFVIYFKKDGIPRFEKIINYAFN